MNFGVVLQTNPPARKIIELAKRAEAAGFSNLWTFDSCVLWQEPFVIYSQVLSNTEHLKVGPMVTNPATRDWTVTASLFATLNELFGPRTVCGIGRGDSAVRVTGGRPTNLAAVGGCIEAVQRLVAGDEIDIEGTSVTIPWNDGSDLDVWMGAYGPKALAVAGTLADGLILQIADPFIVEWASKAARVAVENAGRSQDDFVVCVAAPTYVGDNLSHQRDQVRWFGGMVGNHVADIVARYGDQTDSVPTALTDYIKGREGYDYRHHGKTGHPDTEFVPDNVIDRFCLLGQVPEHLERLRTLELLGVEHFALYLMHDDIEGTLDAYGREIIGQF